MQRSGSDGGAYYSNDNKTHAGSASGIFGGGTFAEVEAANWTYDNSDNLYSSRSSTPRTLIPGNASALGSTTTCLHFVACYTVSDVLYVLKFFFCLVPVSCFLSPSRERP